MNNNTYYYNDNPQSTGGIVDVVSRVMRKVYLKMCLALVVTALTSFFVVSSPALLNLVFSSRIIFFGLIIAELAVVLVLSGMLHKLSSATASLLFYGYAILNGVVLSSVLVIYTGESVATTFLITAGVFAAMSIYGYTTKSDLTKFGSFLFMALIGLIICSLVNLFLQSNTMEWIISLAGVAIFIGLTAWDTQKIKEWAALSYGQDTSKLATMGALSLYLDFVNLFLNLLRLFGDRR